MVEEPIIETQFEQDIRKELAEIKQKTEELKQKEEAQIG